MLAGMRAATWVLALSIGLGACSDEGDDVPLPGATADAGPPVTLKVMTRNLFLGSDVGADLLMGMLPATTADIPPRAAALWDNVQGSDIPARAELVADEIAAAQPDIIGIQEAEMFRTQAPSDIFANHMINAPDVAFDFLASLTAGLEKRGLKYDAFVNQLTDFEVPTGRDPAMLIDVRLTDRDVILIRQGITHGTPVNNLFATYLPVDLGKTDRDPGIHVEIKRGFQTMTVDHQGAHFTFLNAHLEVGGQFLKLFQQAQAKDLAAALDGIAGTIVAVGDFNSAADHVDTTSYGQIAAKLTEAWPQIHPMDPGLTCCAPLADPGFKADGRIDLVFYRGGVNVQAAEIVGAEKRTAKGLRASDHAGVVVTLSLPKS